MTTNILVSECICCYLSFETKDRGFEQILIDDTAFCPDCWKNVIMKDTEDADLKYLDTLLIR